MSPLEKLMTTLRDAVRSLSQLVAPGRREPRSARINPRQEVSAPVLAAYLARITDGLDLTTIHAAHPVCEFRAPIGPKLSAAYKELLASGYSQGGGAFVFTKKGGLRVSFMPRRDQFGETVGVRVVVSQADW